MQQLVTLVGTGHFSGYQSLWWLQRAIQELSVETKIRSLAQFGAKLRPFDIPLLLELATTVQACDLETIAHLTLNLTLKLTFNDAFKYGKIKC